MSTIDEKERKYHDEGRKSQELSKKPAIVIQATEMVVSRGWGGGGEQDAEDAHRDCQLLMEKLGSEEVKDARRQEHAQDGPEVIAGVAVVLLLLQ